MGCSACKKRREAFMAQQAKALAASNIVSHENAIQVNPTPQKPKSTVATRSEDRKRRSAARKQRIQARYQKSQHGK